MSELPKRRGLDTALDDTYKDTKHKYDIADDGVRRHPALKQECLTQEMRIKEDVQLRKSFQYCALFGVNSVGGHFTGTKQREYCSEN